MTNPTHIVIDPAILRADFPYFEQTSDAVIMAAAKSVNSYISTIPGAINLEFDLQVRGNYLACCHILYMQMNPDLAKTIPLASASEGDVSSSFKQFKNWLEYALALSPYGLELLVILSTVRPPEPRRPTSPWPYYRGTYGGRI